MTKMWKKSSSDSFLPQPDIRFTRGWCTADLIKLNFSETSVILLHRKTDDHCFEYALTLLKFWEYLLNPGFFYTIVLTFILPGHDVV